jgi:uncharacterized protein (DUF1501 family)
MLMWTEFGRRVKDNGAGTDHGAGGTAFVLGDPVKGGTYGEYPSLKESDLTIGNLKYNNDFRSTYTTILENWLHLDAKPIVNGSFEKFAFVSCILTPVFWGTHGCLGSSASTAVLPLGRQPGVDRARLQQSV